jgi:signal transduction histidine kinase
LRLQEDKNGDAMYQYAIESIVQECEHLGHMMQELLDVSRMDQVKLELKRRSCDLLALLKGAVARHNSTTKSHDITFLPDGLAEQEKVMGFVDSVRIEQVINNLLTNAIKYSPNGGQIEVHVSPRRNDQDKIEELSVMVKDEGIGIAARDLPHIFERFYRAETLTNSSISGFGIGLYLTKELVQAHGGRIWVESIKGQGSTFFVVLPLSGA